MLCANGESWGLNRMRTAIGWPNSSVGIPSMSGMSRR
jgi:hypothetical protein